MIEVLEESVRRRGKPFLGICVGLQLMAERGLEHGLTPGLGWIEGEVRAIEPSDPSLKIPHMGWNTLKLAREHALLELALREGVLVAEAPATVVALHPVRGDAALDELAVDVGDLAAEAVVEAVRER